ncbi:MAG: CPBP family intramembrane metalloprotease [Clostridia bacterium]|nr:CPBP family intramembrane metalloprotease [Clostridia bacterium]
MNRIKSNGVLLFLILVFALGWAVQFGCYFLTEPVAILIAQYLISFIPLIAVLLTCKVIRKEETGVGLELRFKQNWKTFFLSWMSTFALVAVCTAFYYFCFKGEYDRNCGYYAQFVPENVTGMGVNPVDFVPLDLLQNFLLAPFYHLLIVFGEEFGWRGYLMTQLEGRFGLKKSLLLAGLISGVWRFPQIVLYGYAYGDGYTGAPFLGLLLFAVYSVAIHIFLSYFYYKTRSIWYSSFAAAVIYSCAPCAMYFLPGDPANTLLGPTITGAVAMVPLAVTAILIFFLSPFGGRARFAPKSSKYEQPDYSRTALFRRGGRH